MSPESRGGTVPPIETRSFISVVIETRPALADVAEAQRVGHAHVGEEALVELGLAGHLVERAHLDAGRVHVDEEGRDALVLGHVGVGARDDQAEAPTRGPASSTPSGR